MGTPHLLVVMGSGETTPTMVTPHQELLRDLGSEPHAVVLDTPYGFQENADELSARTQQYFSHNVGTEVDVVSLRRPVDADDIDLLTACTAVEDADWLFIGPGSPSYLTTQLGATRVPQLLRQRVGASGHGVTIVSSAAAATIGARTLPVYEIYKVGADVHWMEGLGLLETIGLDAVLIPHFDNAEGGGHDTRYCYMGERRLLALEEQLPEQTWVLGVDEHTCIIIDLTTGSCDVRGRGVVTVRNRGHVTTFEAGTQTSLDELRAAASGASGPEPADDADAHDADEAAHDDSSPDVDPNAAPLLEAVTAAKDRFTDAVRARDASAATAAVLELDTTVRDWQADPTAGTTLDDAAGALRGLVTRLGALAEGGVTDRSEVVGPFIDALVSERTAARDDRRWADADRIRDTLAELGVELRDGPEGTTWHLED